MQAKSELVRKAVNEHRQEMGKNDVETIVAVLEANNYSKELLEKELIEYEDKEIIASIVNQLHEEGLWAEPKTQPVVQPESFSEFELEGLIEEYLLLLKVVSTDPMVEMQLQKCLLMAFRLKNKVPIQKINVPGFESLADEQAFRQELQVFAKLAKQENLLTAKAKTLLQRLFDEDCTHSEKVGPYEVLQSFKKELKGIDVRELHRLIAQADKAGEKIKGYKSGLILFVGDTGCGKTTTIKALLGYKMSRQTYNNISTIDVDEQVRDQTVRQMRCNPGCKSVTRYVVVAKPKESVTYDDIMLADTPGFNDTAGIEVEFANMIGMKRALRQAKSIRIAVIVGKDSWGSRYNGIRQLARTVSMLFSDYRQCKQAVTIMFNNQTCDDVKQKSSQFKEILKESAATDRNDENFCSFINHLHEVTAESDENGKPKFLIYDPLSNKPKEAMKLLLQKKPLTKLLQVFSEKTPSGFAVKNYCSDIDKRVQYLLERNNLAAVKHFMDELELFSQDIQSESCEKEHKRIMEYVLAKVKERNRAPFDSINEKIQQYEVTEDEINKYRVQVDKISGSDAKWLLGDTNYQKEAEGNISEQAQALRLQIVDGLDEKVHNEGSLIKISLTIYTLHKGFEKVVAPIYQKLLKELKQIQDGLRKQYESLLKKAEGVTTVDQPYLKLGVIFTVQAALKGLSTERLQQEVKQNLSELSKAISKAITSNQERGEEVMKYITEKNIEQVRDIDIYFRTLKENHQLVKELSPEIRQLIREAPKRLKERVKEVSNELVNGMNSLLNNISKQLERNEASTFASNYSKLVLLGRIECIAQKVQFDRLGLESSMLQKIEEQVRKLHHFNESLKRNNSNLLQDMKSMNTFVNVIEQLLGVFSKETAEKGRESLKETLSSLGTQLPTVLKKMFKGKIYEELSEQKLERIKDAYQLEEFFTKNGQRYEEHRKITADINQENKRKLLQQLNSNFTGFEALEESNIHFANKPKELSRASISFQKVEKLLRVIGILLDAHGVSYLKEVIDRAVQLEDTTEKMLMQFRGSITKSVDVLRECFMDTKLDQKEVEENCSNVCSNLQRKLKELDEIERYPNIRKLVLHDDKQLRNQLELKLQQFAEDFHRKFGNLLTVEEAKYVLVKCISIKKLGKSSLTQTEDVIQRFQAVQNNAVLRIERDLDKNQKMLSANLKSREYSALRNTVQTIQEKHGANHECLEELVEQLKDMVVELEKQVRRRSYSKEVDIDQTLETTKNMIGLASIQGFLSFKLPEKLLASQKTMILKQLQSWTTAIRNLNQERVHEGFVEALEALDQLLCFRNNMDQTIIDFLGSSFNEKEVEEYQGKLKACFTKMEQKLQDQLNEEELVAYADLFHQRPTLSEYQFRTKFERLRVSWEEYCKRSIESRINKTKAIPSYKKRKNAVQALNRQLEYSPTKMRQGLKEDLKQLEEDADKEFEGQKKKLRTSLSGMTQLDISDFKPHLTFLETETDIDLDEMVYQTINRLLQQNSANLTVNQFLRYYHEKISKFLNSSSSEFNGFMSQRCFVLQRKCQDILNNKLTGLSQQFSQDCLQAVQNIDDTKFNEAIYQSLVNCIHNIADSLHTTNTDQSPNEKSDAMASSVQGCFKEIVKEIDKLLSQFLNALRRYPEFSVSTTQGAAIMSQTFQSVSTMKQLLQKIKLELGFLSSVKSTTVTDMVNTLEDQFSNVFAEYQQSESGFCKSYEQANEFVTNYRFTSNLLRGQSPKQIRESLLKYKVRLQFREAFTELYNFLNKKKCSFDIKSISQEAQEMNSRCIEELKDLDKTTDISKYSFREVWELVGYLQVYQNVFTSSKFTKELESSIRQHADKIMSDSKKLTNKPRQEDLRQIACCIVKLKVLQFDVPPFASICSAVTQELTKSIPKNMIKKLLGLIRETGNPYCHRLLPSENQSPINQQSLELEDCKPFLSKFPVKYKNLEEAYDKCRDAFNAELENYKGDGKISEEELAEATRRLPSRIHSKSNEVKKLMEEGKAAPGYELLGMLLAMQTIYTSSTDSDKRIIIRSWPKCMEILALLLLLGICESKNTALRNCLGKIVAGQQDNHFITAIMAAYLSLVGYGVHVLNNSPVANSINRGCFRELYDNLNISQMIYYGTIPQLITRIYREDYPNIDEEVQSLVLSDKRKTDNPQKTNKRILLIDEANTFFEQGLSDKIAGFATSIRPVCLAQLVLSIKTNYKYFKPQILQKSPSYLKCVQQIPYLKQIIDSNIEWMLSYARTHANGYMGKETVEDQEVGWKQYFTRVFKAKTMTSVGLDIVYGAVPYLALPTYYNFSIGVTYVFDQMTGDERDMLTKQFSMDKIIEIPQTANRKLNKSHGATFTDDPGHSEKLTEMIERLVQKKTPSVVFFESDSKLYDFYKKAEFKNRIVIRKQLTANDLDRPNKSIIELNEVVLTSGSVSKGIGFSLSAEERPSSTGIHVIITYLPHSPAEMALIENCAYSKAIVGSYQYLLTPNDLDKLNIIIGRQDEQEAIHTEKYVKQEIAKIHQQNVEQNKGRIRRKVENRHETSCNFVHRLYNNCIKDAQFHLLNMNLAVKSNKIVIAIQGSTHMTEHLKTIPSMLQAFGVKLAKELRNVMDSGRVTMQIVSYTNYDCTLRNILCCQNIGSDPTELYQFVHRISPEGKLPSQAVELVIDHCLSQYDVSQIVIIATSPANTPSQVDQIMQKSGPSLKGTPYEQKVRNTLLNELVDRKIPVNCFYFGKENRQHFEKLSTGTKGLCREDLPSEISKESLREFLEEVIIKPLVSDKQ